MRREYSAGDPVLQQMENSTHPATRRLTWMISLGRGGKLKKSLGTMTVQTNDVLYSCASILQLLTPCPPTSPTLPVKVTLRKSSLLEVGQHSAKSPFTAGFVTHLEYWMKTLLHFNHITLIFVANCINTYVNVTRTLKCIELLPRFGLNVPILSSRGY